MANNDNVLMEGVRIIFRNFKGAESQYNAKGDRNFGVLLNEDTAAAMLADGWNIKFLKPRESDDPRDEGEVVEPPQAWLSVSMKYPTPEKPKIRPPKISMVTSRGRTRIGEDLVETLDWVDIETVDIIVRPYRWEVNGNTGIKAYVENLFVTIREDELERKYGHLDEQSVEAEPREDDAPF